MATMAYDRRRDRNLRVIPLTHLFEASTCYIMIKERRYLERHIKDFIGLVKSMRPPRSDDAVAAK